MPKQKPMHMWARKKRKGVRRKGILWEYDCDGLYAQERIKGSDKQYWKRWSRRNEKYTQEEFDNYMNGSWSSYD